MFSQINLCSTTGFGVAKNKKPCAHVSLQIVFYDFIVTIGEHTSFGMYIE
jgi:hypothetical protein